jgi:protoporphyrinogen oxidase
MTPPQEESLERCVIIGAGPAGLTAAYELCKLDVPAVVLEKDDIVGGISRTGRYKDYLFDIGGHRFFTKVDYVQEIWEEILGEAFLVRPRLSRIYYDDRFFDYPLKPVNALLGLGPVEALRIGFSYLKAQLFPAQEERTFEQWVSNRFGRRLYEIFFETYTEKVWGMPCSEISAEWAAQRIKNLDLVTVAKNALLGRASIDGEVVSTLIEQFHYPRRGPGMMWERCAGLLAEKGYETRLGVSVTGIHHENGLIRSVVVQDEAGRETRVEGAHFLSSMPIRELVHALDPAPPPEVLEAASRLRYRDFLTVLLVVDRADVFPDNWIYIHSPDVKLGRIQNFKNWSPEMVPRADRTSLGLEYFVQEDDELWSAPDSQLIELGARECEQLGLLEASEVVDGHVVRMPKAYPVYAGDWQEALTTIRAYLQKLPNLQLVGRNGLHRYNNQDHSMVSAVYAARNITGGDYDVWGVNVDEEYHEEVRESSSGGDRLVPQRVPRRVDEELIAAAFARYDPIALGAALAVVLGLGLFLATSVLLVQSGGPVGPNLSLLGNYFIGYSVTWTGAFVGLAEASLGGFGFGYCLARLINGVVAWHEIRLRRAIEMRSSDLLEGEA